MSISEAQKPNGPTEKNHPYQCEKSNSKQHGQILECVLEVCHDNSPLSGHTVVEQGERQAVVVAEAMLVRMVAVIPSVLTVHAQVPLTCRDTERETTNQTAFHFAQLLHFNILHTPVYLSLTCTK